MLVPGFGFVQEVEKGWFTMQGMGHSQLPRGVGWGERK